MKLNQEDVVHLSLVCLGKLNSIHGDLKNNFDKVRVNFAKLVADIHISGDFNYKI